MLKPIKGEVLLEDKPMSQLKSKVVAQKVALLAQHNSAPTDMTVKQLVYYGRYPHKRWCQRRNREDEEIVNWSMQSTGVLAYKERRVATLSGGERQRVWLAMALAQKPDILFLDEPTTYLDISHQLELMELVKEINNKFNMTIVMVLHELNQASRYSDYLFIMKKGNIVASGKPKDIINEDILQEVYPIECEIDQDPISENPRIHPMTIYKESV